MATETVLPFMRFWRRLDASRHVHAVHNPSLPQAELTLKGRILATLRRQGKYVPILQGRTTECAAELAQPL